MRLLLANPRGFCAGVTRALAILDHALSHYPPPVYVRHEIVHNTHVVSHYRQRGVIFIETPEEAPESAVVIISAHGASRDLYQRAQKRHQHIIDATCPLVSKVHADMIRGQQKGAHCLLIGHRGHPEIEGTLGQSQGEITLIENLADIAKLPDTLRDRDLFYATQTTLSILDTQALIDALQTRFPHIQAPHKKDICYATENRQQAVLSLAKHVDYCFIIGSNNSSNANRLKEISAAQGTPTELVDHTDQLCWERFAHCQSLGLSAGASTPESVIQDFLSVFKTLGVTEIHEWGDREQEKTIHFSHPQSAKKATISSARDKASYSPKESNLDKNSDSNRK